MVKVTDSLAIDASGQIDIDAWLARLVEQNEAVRQAPERLEQVARDLSNRAIDIFPRSAELTLVVGALHLDMEGLLAALLYRAVRMQRYSMDEVADSAGEAVADLLREVLALAGTSLLELSDAKLQSSENASQVANIRSMLIAVIDDPRVAVLKVAERVVALRHAKYYGVARRTAIAKEALYVFAPLAARLGIGQLKWELEDLAFRYSDETQYKAIAKQLAGRRQDHEAGVAQIVKQISDLLSAQDIAAEVYGRAKHIYSIWRKMQAKGVDFDEVYDVRAIRIIVRTLGDCYGALSVIHSRWQHVPTEFDDYIANPKENGYRSLHTAVTLEDGLTLEIQIRTQAMHEDAELGVCAHWSYKEGAEQHASVASSKMEWLRQVLEWHEDLAGEENISTLLKHRVSDDRIYVATPKGHVLDLPAGATVLDFAYRVHTDLGHGCRGARVNGISVPLDQTLTTSQQVDIIAGTEPHPHRLWLEPDLAYIYAAGRGPN